MIRYKDEYLDWIVSQGVGAKDRVASSPNSYISYLNGVSELIGKPISPDILSSESDIDRIVQRISGMKAPGTIRNYVSAMRQYVAMVRNMLLRGRLKNPAEPTDSTVTSPSIPKMVPAEEMSPRDADADPANTSTAHNLYSSYREALLEHLFAGEVMRHLWIRGNIRIETLKPQVDDSGYDLVLEANGAVRHVQLKSSHAGSSTANVKVSLHLAKKPSGCVIWLWFDEETLELGPFLWFGGEPGKPLPDIRAFHVAKHTKGNSQGEKLLRPNIRVVPKGSFEELRNIEEVVRKLFGEFRPAQEV